MAVEIRIAGLKLVNVSSDKKTVIDKDSPGTTLAAITKTSKEFRVIRNGTGSAESPNSTGHPTIEAYLEAEAADNFSLAYIDQSRIITQKIT